MDRDWAHERVVRFIAEHTGRAPESIRTEESLVSLDVDSLEDVEFIVAIEDELQVEIPDPVSPLVTIGDLVALVCAAMP